MQRMSFIRSLMLFNERVLYNGIVNIDKVYTVSELKNKLFFNKIFIENMQEAFQRHDCSSIIDRYIDSLGQYVENIFLILNRLKGTDPSVNIGHDMHFGDRLKFNVNLDNSFVNVIQPLSKQLNYKFNNNMIYYMIPISDEEVIISHVSPGLSIADKVLTYTMHGKKRYWKSDDFFTTYLNHLYGISNVIAFRVTTSANNQLKITKVEYNGDPETMKKYTRIFPKNAFIIQNLYIYLDDIERIMDSIIEPESKKHKQHFEDITFNDIFKGDIIMEYPNTSFDVYLDLLSKASNDSDVSDIYLSLYRIGKDPTIYYILKDAVDNGIKVHVNIELCASGEFINRLWVKEMSNAGMEVTTYANGILKVHSKLTLFMFKSGRSIAQIGTGNYHTKTTSQYTDLSLMTSNQNICDQVLNVFNILSEKCNHVMFDSNLLVTKYNARHELSKLIKRQASLGSNGYIAMKCNALDDESINSLLDEAARNNCQIDLIVRGVCTWVPDQIGSNVRIKSIVWDKLEHSRVYCFGNVNPTIYIGSLDLVTNKLDKRIETLVKILDADVLSDVCDYLNHYITNAANSWKLLRSGEYRKEEI